MQASESAALCPRELSCERLSSTSVFTANPGICVSGSVVEIGHLSSVPRQESIESFENRQICMRE
jgi:hypothetical protein